MQYDEFSDEAVLNPAEVMQSNRDILSVKFIESIDGTIDANELMQLKSRSRHTHDLPGPGALKKRLLEYIHIRSCENMPVRLMDLNRVFQHPARRTGQSVKVLTQQLLNTKRIMELEQSNVAALFSSVIWDEKVALSLASGGPGAVGMASQLMSNIGF